MSTAAGTTKSDQEWREQLTPEQYNVLRRKGTERPFTGNYNDTKERGTYRCAGCGATLFHSGDKFDSGTGWPSFTAPAAPDSVEMREDNFLFMRRTEVVCRACGGHLGHVFDDGPRPTGKRFCINSCALDLAPDEVPSSESATGGDSALAPEHSARSEHTGSTEETRR